MTRAAHPAPTGHRCEVPSSSRRSLALSVRDERRWDALRDPDSGDPVFACPDCGQWWGHGPGGQGHHGRFWQPLQASLAGHQPDAWPALRARERAQGAEHRSSPAYVAADRARRIARLRGERAAFEARVSAERDALNALEERLQAELDAAKRQLDDEQAGSG